jgi:hypothetical protein
MRKKEDQAPGTALPNENEAEGEEFESVCEVNMGVVLMW